VLKRAVLSLIEQIVIYMNLPLSNQIRRRYFTATDVDV
jgi:hypothetical protein